MSLLERMIGWASPELALKRARARAALGMVRAYEGARSDRRTENWRATGSSANVEVGQALARLRNRSRDMLRNNGYARRAAGTLISNAIGTGILARWPGRNDSLWKDWAEDPSECDYYGELDFNGLEALAGRTVLESGACLVRRRPVASGQNETVPLRLQLLEPDYIDMARVGLAPNGNYILYGVEIDRAGRRAAYWLFDNHPGDVLTPMYTGGFQSKRVPASEILYVYEKERAGQIHGVPRLSSALIKLRDLDEYEEAELVRKKIEACFTAFVKGPGRDIPLSDNSKTDNTKSYLPRVETFQPGTIMYGAEDEEITFGSPNVTGGYAEYTGAQLRAIAMAAGVTYEQLTGDLSKVNFTSMRMGVQEFRMLVEQFRWLTFIPTMCRGSAKWWVEAAYLAGKIRTLKYKPSWTPPRWQYVQPEVDVKTELLEIAGGLDTHYEKLRARGTDPEEFIQEKEEELAAFKKAGLSFQYGTGKLGNGVTVADESTAGGADDGTADAGADKPDSPGKVSE